MTSTPTRLRADQARRLAFRGAGVLVIAAVCLVIVAPILVTLGSSFWTGDLIKLPGSWGLVQYRHVLASPSSMNRLLNTLEFTVGATLVAMVLGAALAIIVTRTDVPFRRVLQALPLLPLFLPGLLKDVAWIELYSPKSGLVNLLLHHLGVHHPIFNIFSMQGMILSDGICGAAIPYIVLLGPLRNMDPALEEASRSSGARHLRTILRVTLPVLRPALISGLALTSVMVASEFETPVLIGRPGNVLTYMSELYSSVGSAAAPNYDLASARAMVYLVFTSLLLIWYVRSTRVESRFTLVGGRGQSAARMSTGPYRWLLAAFVVLYFVVAAGQLVVTTVLVSLVPFYTASDGNPFKKFDLENYRNTLSTSSTVTAIEHSLYLSVLVAIACVIVAATLSFVSLKTNWRGRRVVEVIATLPIGLPPVVFSAALLITVLSVPGFVQLYGTIVPLVVADVVVTLPFAIRVITGALISIQSSLLEASAASGAGMARTLRKILVPLLLPAAGNAAVLVFVRSFLQLGAVVFLITPSFNLLPTTIFALWGTGQYGQVSALNVVSVVLPIVVLLLARGVQALSTTLSGRLRILAERREQTAAVLDSMGPPAPAG